MLGKLLKAAIEPVSEAYQAKQQVKVAEIQEKAAVQKMVVKGDNEVRLTQKQWELAKPNELAGSYKDEIATVVLLGVLVLVVVGAMFYVPAARFEAAASAMTVMFGTFWEPTILGACLLSVIIGATGVRLFRGRRK